MSYSSRRCVKSPTLTLLFVLRRAHHVLLIIAKSQRLTNSCCDAYKGHFHGEQAVDGAQVVLNFDPSLLEVVSVRGGERLPQGLQNEVDNESGTLRFAAGTLEGFPNGRIEVLEVELRALAPTDATSLSFGEGTEVTFGGVSVLGEQAGSTIVISEPTAIRVQELAAPATAGWLWALLPLGLTLLAGALISRRRR